MDQKKYRLRTLKYHRRRSQKTNYVKRLNTLKSDKTRLVVRLKNNLAIAQLVNYHDDGDKVLLTVKSTDLIPLGWKHNVANLPGLYLTGALISKTAKDKKIKIDDIIVDMGVKKYKHKTKIYALIKGALDNGMGLNVDSKVFPADNRIGGQHIQDYASKSNEVHKLQFTKKKADSIVKDFNELKSKLIA